MQYCLNTVKCTSRGPHENRITCNTQKLDKAWQPAHMISSWGRTVFRYLQIVIYEVAPSLLCNFRCSFRCVTILSSWRHGGVSNFKGCRYISSILSLLHLRFVLFALTHILLCCSCLYVGFFYHIHIWYHHNISIIIADCKGIIIL